VLRRWIAANLAVLGLLAVLTAAGGALRVEPAANPSRYQSVDERAYARLARNLARHGTYDAPEMADPVRWPPGAPVVFAAAHKVRPVLTEGERWDVPSAYPLQWLFSTATIPAAFALAFVLAGPAVGLAAAAAIAFYPPLIGVTGDLLTEPLGALMLTVALTAVVLALRRRTGWWALGAGLLLGLTVLVRADLVAVPLLLAILLGVVAWRAEGRRRGLVLAGVMLAGILVPTAPWSAYASSVAGKPVPVSSGGASNLFVGTYVPGDGSMFGLKRELAADVGRRYPELRDEPFWRLPQQRVIDTVAARRPELDREAALRAAALENVREHVVGDPVGFTAMSGRKAWRLWGDYTVGTYRNRRAWITAYHLLLVGIGFAGLLAGLVRGPRRLELAAPAIVVGYVTAVNLVLVSEARHNLPIMPVLVAGGLAGLALAAQYRGIGLLPASWRMALRNRWTTSYSSPEMSRRSRGSARRS
jgi:4-amino-4-deoxy-L-arabinose transferase-like glycosyltransferase